MQKLRTVLPALTAVLLTAALLTAVLPTAGIAAEEPRRAGILSELKLGLLQHDVDLIAAGGNERGQAINGEILFRSPAFLDFAFSPRPHLGATASFEGETDHVYAGLTWTLHPFGEGALAPLWLSASAGGAVHDGELESRDPDVKALGSRVLFRYAFEIGYDVTERASVSAYLGHISNAWLAEPNNGMDQVGLRIGWRF